MNKKKLFIIGSGGHASACIDLIESVNSFKIVGIFSDDKKVKKKFSYSVIGTTKDIFKYKKITNNVVLGFGSIYNLKKRHNIYLKLKKAGFKFPTIISKKSHVSDRSKILEGSQIFHNCTVNAGSIISENCILNNNSLIDHDCKIGAFTTIGHGSNLAGNVSIKENCVVGISSTIKQKIKVSSGVIIGSASNVVKNCQKNKKYYGNPAKQFLKK